MKKMDLKTMPKNFVEGIHPSWMKAELPEDLSKIPYISLKEKRDKSLGLYCVDSYYGLKKGKSNKKNYPFVRMLIEYQAKDFDEAYEKAKKNGLAKGIMIEQILGEPVKCNLAEALY